MNSETSFLDLSKLCEALVATTKRNEKKDLISRFLLKFREDEILPAVDFITGEVFSESDARILEIGGQTLWKILEEKKQMTLTREHLTILSLRKYFEDIASIKGIGSRNKKKSIVKALISMAEPLEAKYLVRLLQGEMRLGAIEGVMLEAISDVTSIDLDLIRRGNMLLGNLGEVARIALKQGKKSLEKIGLELFTPIKPMLAEMSYDIGEVISTHGRKTAFEYKLFK